MKPTTNECVWVIMQCEMSTLGRNFIILWYKSPFVTRREIFFHMWLTELEISHFIIKGFPVFVRKMAWDICLHSLSMRPYSLFCRSQINTPEIISKYQRITPNRRFAHIPFRSGRKAWCVGVIFQRQINIHGIMFIHHRITPPWVCGIHFATCDKHSGSYFLILWNNSPFSNWEEPLGNMCKYIHNHLIT